MKVLAEPSKMRLITERLAFEAHTRRKDQAADLPRGDLITILDDNVYLADTGLAAEFLTYVDQRAGLLIGRGGGAGRPAQYAFPHRSVQEYLAGCQLLRGRDMLRGREVDRTYLDLVPEGDYWALAALMGAEELYYNRGDLGALLNLMYALCPVAEPQSADDWRAVLWAGQMALLPERAAIAGDTIRDGGEAFLTRLRTRLLGVMQDSDLTSVERAQAGRVLAKLGDPRVEVLEPLQIAWCDVPAGSFTMGGDAWNTDGKQFNYEIPYAYRMARYPVTNAQFAAFVDDGGYQEARYWREAEAAKRWSMDGVTMLGDESPRIGPRDYGEPVNLATHPVVGVSWYEALAFTRWLTEQLHASEQLDAEWAIRLPNEPEWEKAARGVDGRTYPWAGGRSPDCANYNESGVGTTNAVGAFPEGESPYGCEEMAGNIWEWTRSLYADYPYPNDPKALAKCEDLTAGNSETRVLRGGSFYRGEFNVRCAARALDNPYLVGDNGGFRIVAAPIPLDDEGSER